MSFVVLHYFFDRMPAHVRFDTRARVSPSRVVGGGGASTAFECLSTVTFFVVKYY